MLEKVVEVSNTDNNKKNDADVLRGEDIVPPYNNQPNRKEYFPASATDREEDISSQNPDGNAAEHDDAVQQKNEIPSFDLAEQIMAEQRKITAVRRKAPGGKVKIPGSQSPNLSKERVIKESSLILPEKDPIIAEIVERDIEMLYRGIGSNMWDW